MSKLPKSKSKVPSLHSRAAKRSSTGDAHADLASLPRHTTVSSTATHMSSGGVTKRKSKQKPLSRQKRIRKEMAINRAGGFADKLEVKRGRSSKKGAVVKSRGADWDELNVKIEEEVAKEVERAAAATVTSK